MDLREGVRPERNGRALLPLTLSGFVHLVVVAAALLMPPKVPKIYYRHQMVPLAAPPMETLVVERKPSPLEHQPLPPVSRQRPAREELPTPPPIEDMQSVPEPSFGEVDQPPPPEMPVSVEPPAERILVGIFAGGETTSAARKTTVPKVETGSFAIETVVESSPERPASRVGVFAMVPRTLAGTKDQVSDGPVFGAFNNNGAKPSTKPAGVRSTRFQQIPSEVPTTRLTQTSAVKSGRFETVIARPRAANSHVRAKTAPVETPLEILGKPKPAYTPEARKLRIEGKVSLKVCFRADGRVDVVEILQGLGYGLDETAIQTAQAIRFRPARRNGQPIDSIAVVRIEFQLAY